MGNAGDLVSIRMKKVKTSKYVLLRFEISPLLAPVILSFLFL